MALTQAYWISKVSYDVGAPLPGGPANQDPILGQYLTALAAQLPDYYLEAEGQVAGPGGVTTASVVQLVYLFTRRSAVWNVLGFLGSQTTARLASVLNLSLEQKFDHYEKLLKDTEAEIDVLLRRLSANRRMALGRLLQTAPIQYDLPPLAPGPGQPAPEHDPWRPDPNRRELFGIPPECRE